MNAILAAIEWKDVLPSIIGGVCSLAAALLALVGLLWSLKHHRERERISREVEMRRQVYFDMCDAVAHTMVSAECMANLNVSDDELLKKTAGYAPAMARFAIVCPGDHAAEFYAMHKQILDLLVPAIALRQQLQLAKTNLDQGVVAVQSAGQTLRKLHEAGASLADSRMRDVLIKWQEKADDLNEVQKLFADAQRRAVVAGAMCAYGINALSIDLALKGRAVFDFPVESEKFFPAAMDAFNFRFDLLMKIAHISEEDIRKFCAESSIKDVRKR